jgi:hypothetical protein
MNRTIQNRLNTPITRLAGASYALIITLAILTLIIVDPHFPLDDIDKTVTNLATRETLFRMGVLADIIMFALVLVTSISLYYILKPVNSKLAFTGLLFRFGEGLLGAVATILGGMIPLVMNGGSDPGRVVMFMRAELASMEMILIFMGIGALIFFILFLKSNLIPRFFSIWGIITYSVMITLSTIKIIAPSIPDSVTVAVYAPGSLFELSFGLWLLFKGIKPGAGYPVEELK